MHLVGLGYKLLEHRLRTFLLISLRLRKELQQEEALELQVFLLPPPKKKKKKKERRMVVFEHLEKTWITNIA